MKNIKFYHQNEELTTFCFCCTEALFHYLLVIHQLLGLEMQGRKAAGKGEYLTSLLGCQLQYRKSEAGRRASLWQTRCPAVGVQSP